MTSVYSFDIPFTIVWRDVYEYISENLVEESCEYSDLFLEIHKKYGVLDVDSSDNAFLSLRSNITTGKHSFLLGIIKHQEIDNYLTVIVERGSRRDIASKLGIEHYKLLGLPGICSFSYF